MCPPSWRLTVTPCRYVRSVKFSPRSLRVRVTAPANTMLIDWKSVHHLELIASSHGSVKTSLFGVVNHTRTAVGARLLRAQILSPPSTLDTITRRQDAVEELLSDEETFHELGRVGVDRTPLDASSSIGQGRNSPFLTEHRSRLTASSTLISCSPGFHTRRRR